MKLKINTKIIKELNPCQDRLDNWLKYYSDFKGDILDFLELENITALDKVWVSLKLLPRDIVEIFSIDCAFRADAAYAVYVVYADAADAAAAADAACAAAYAAADAADATDARLQERENQVDALIMLIKGE